MSSNHYPEDISNRCYNTSDVAPLIRLGTIYTQWFGEVVITQLKQENVYIPEDMNIYVVPSEYVVMDKTIVNLMANLLYIVD